mmetsp:Transcript_43926/g.108186  ORF Transcript_43926/g.108186 Transcript_43926/m.108186 type:complete len:225 (-) Transcript_43926:152-826(-)
MAMSDAEATKQIDQMVNFILSEAKEKASDIERKAEEDFNIEKLKIVEGTKKKIRTEFENKAKKVVTQVAINKSTAVNRARLRKIAERQEIIAKVKDQAAGLLAKKVGNQGEYKALIVDLIVQGALQLLEKEVLVRCRPEDKSVVEGCLKDASAKYADFIKKSCGATVSLTLTMDSKTLPASAIGGVVLACHGGKITLDNTLNARLGLVMENDKPEIRKQLFPVH